MKWHRKSTGMAGLPMAEDRVYNYVKELQKTAAATAPATFLASCNFAHFLLQVEGAEAITKSLRITGACYNSAKTKKPLQQRRTLTVDEVRSLETIARTSTSDHDKYAALFFLATLYSRSRYTGICLASTVIGDFNADGEGFVEFNTLQSKTQVTAQQKSTFLPLVAPCVGVSGYNWGQDFIAERERQGISKFTYMLPWPGSKVLWIDEPLDVTSAGKWLRDLLRSEGHVLVDLIATHSLKATTLAWAAKFDLPLESRALLGYHVARELTSTLCYSRDAQAGPLRLLMQLIAAIREGRFLPDATRSGRLLDGPLKDVRTVREEGQPTKKMKIVSDLMVVRTDPYVEEDKAEERDEGKLDDEVGSVVKDLVSVSDAASDTDSSSEDSSEEEIEPNLANRILPAPICLLDHLPFVHKLSYVVHAKSPDCTKLKCGRKVAASYRRKEWEEVDSYFRCTQCFR